MTKLPTFTKTLFSTIVIIYDCVYEFDVCIDKSSGLLIFKSDIKGLLFVSASHSELLLLLLLPLSIIVTIPYISNLYTIIDWATFHTVFL